MCAYVCACETREVKKMKENITNHLQTNVGAVSTRVSVCVRLRRERERNLRFFLIWVHVKGSLGALKVESR